MDLKKTMQIIIQKISTNSKRLAVIFMLFFGYLGIYSQEQNSSKRFIEKKYIIFFRINNSTIDKNFKDNSHTISQMVHDIRTTLELEGSVADSLLILSTASPDGNYDFNKRLAQNRAANTKKFLLELFPQFKDAHIKVEYVEEDWDGLMQILKTNPNFPQREAMMEVINDSKDINAKETRLRALKSGWKYLERNYIHTLRNSSVTLQVIMVSEKEPVSWSAPQVKLALPPSLPDAKMDPLDCPPTLRNSIFALRSNLLLPGLNVGIEVPIGTHWSVGADYYYPWFVSDKNRWCVEMLGWFIDGKYWFTGEKYKWSMDSKLKGHAVGAYAGIGYYDFQNKPKGRQGEYLDVGFDYTFAKPICNDKLRIVFNLGLGYIRTVYRPYHPSSDYEDLIKDPGVKHLTKNFFGPTRAAISIELPIKVKMKATPSSMKIWQKFEKNK